jgi:hypothetical protein
MCDVYYVCVGGGRCRGAGTCTAVHRLFSSAAAVTMLTDSSVRTDMLQTGHGVLVLWLAVETNCHPQAALSHPWQLPYK